MTSNLFSDENNDYHKHIEWSWLQDIISQYAYFEKTKTKFFKNFFSSHDTLTEEFNRLKKYEALSEDMRNTMRDLLQSIDSELDLPYKINSLAKGSILKIGDLNKIIILIESCIIISKINPSHDLDELGLIRLLNLPNLFQNSIKDFRHLVEKDGILDFNKHPELSQVTKKLRDIEEKLRKNIQEILHSPQINKALQFNNFDIVFDRFVIPIRSDSYRSDLGLIVSRSESGQTLYVEPFEIRENCNKRLELIAKIDEIIHQIEAKFSNLLSSKVDSILSLYELVISLDLYLSKTNFHLSYNLNPPTVLNEPGFKFSNLFHPLIKNPVKNDVECSSNHHGIVISGPNTGGKTVFLKSIALSYLLFHNGFYVPALSAELFPYERMFYFGNDLQDISHGLSSFSGEVKNYLQLFGNLGESNLILIDEIFNSTSSDEASALSLAYFQELREKGQCHLIVSTHHQMFKTLIHQNNQFLSCHVGFDTKEMKPTYKIIWGTPGSSMAIDIFKILSNRFNEASSVPEKAVRLLDNKNISYETLLQKVTQKKIELDRLVSSNQQLEIELKNQKGAMEGILNLRLNDEVSKAKKDLDKILSEARELLTQVQKNEITKTRKLDEIHHQLQSNLYKHSPKHFSSPKPEPQEISTNLKITQLKIGDTVFSTQFKKSFSVISLDPRKNEVVIGKGNFKISVPVDKLELSKNKITNPQVNVSFNRSSQALVEIDGRGMRLPDFQHQVEKAIGDLLSGDIPFLSVIHGHGDGILKNWLRNFLKSSPDLIGETPENGNDGETKISLK